MLRSHQFGVENTIYSRYFYRFPHSRFDWGTLFRLLAFQSELIFKITCQSVSSYILITAALLLFSLLNIFLFLIFFQSHRLLLSRFIALLGVKWVNKILFQSIVEKNDYVKII